MQVSIYVAEVRCYLGGERVGSGKEPFRLIHSFEPIPRYERIYTYREFGDTCEQVVRTTGGEVPSITVHHLGGELSTGPGRISFKLPRTNWLNPEALIARARSESEDCWFAAPKRPARGVLTVSFDSTPPGPIVPTTQTSFAF